LLRVLDYPEADVLITDRLVASHQLTKVDIFVPQRFIIRVVGILPWVWYIVVRVIKFPFMVLPFAFRVFWLLL
jgi:hypothetical protein